MPQSGWLKEAIRPYYLRWLYFPLRPDQRPYAFQACWRYPYQKVAADSVRLLESRSSLPDLLFYPMTDWHTRIQRTQHLVRAFAALGYRCIYVNPHLGREFETTPLFDKAHRLACLEDNIYELHIRLPREPVFHDRLLTPAEEQTIATAIGCVLPHGSTVIQVLSFPLWTGIARRFRQEAGFPMVYDCHDLLSGFHNICGDILAVEDDLLREADLVLFSSQGLLDRYGAAVQKRLLVRNAVTAAQFDHARPAPGEPVAGYVGALDSWFDVEAVRQAALQNPHCRFILGGRIEYEPIGRLRALANVECPGEIPYHEVPELLARFRIALIPFRVTPLTLMTNPIKMYEYFSCGLPVVSSPLPEAVAMGDLVYIGETPAEFASSVTEALAENDSSRRARRKEIAARESWSARVRVVSAEFESLLSCKQGRRSEGPALQNYPEQRF
jgi:glycosyltransferase involved in cell wall biosynthesis